MNWIYWLIITIILIVFEILTVNVVCIWFIASALISLILSLFIDSIVIQVGVFVILGICLIILTKPFMEKYLINKDSKTNLDRVVGMYGTVTEEISKNVVGEVKVDGKRWSAISNQKLKVGETVKVLKIDSVKIVVERVDE